MTWLLRDSERPAAPVQTAQLRALLSQLENAFSATAEQRRAIDETLGTAYSPPRDAALKNLDRAARQQIATLRDQIGQQFAAAKQQAQANRAKGSRDFHASAEGAQYLTALGVFASLAQQMTDRQLAAKINAAIDTGLIGHARAWAEVGSMRRVTDGDLYTALDRAAAGALTTAEATAQAESTYLDAAERRFGLFDRGTTNDRLAWLLEGRASTAHDGSFSPTAILDGDYAAAGLVGTPASGTTTGGE